MYGDGVRNCSLANAIGGKSWMFLIHKVTVLYDLAERGVIGGVRNEEVVSTLNTNLS